MPALGEASRVVFSRCAECLLPAGQAMRLLLSALALMVAPAALWCAEGRTELLCGIDVLREQNFAPLAGKRIGLITNQTGLALDGTSTIDLFFKAKVCKLKALFSPEHGIRGNLDDKVNASTDASTGLPVYSLYGDTQRPTAEMLKGIDVLVFDIQDIGARFYTYITTMAYCMEEAAKAKIPFFVLDRPNPIGGMSVEGPMLDADKTSFVGYMPLPVRHGMTVGELAGYFNAEKKIGADLHIIELKGWQRDRCFYDTGLLWVNPSPNMRSLNAALLYPGVCLLEQTNVSVGRGTDRPFELIGAPWIEPRSFAAALDAAPVPGVKFVPLYFSPAASIHQGLKCGGVSMVITDPGKVNAVFLGLALAAALNKLYAGEFKIDGMLSLLGNAEALKMLKAGRPPAEILRSGEPGLNEFMAKRQKVLLYGPLHDPKEGNDR